MSVRLRDKDTVIHIRWIPRYTSLERFMHWVHTGSFLPLALTGLILFSPVLQAGVGSVAMRNLRILHRIAAVFFGATPIVYALVQPRRMLMHIREFFSFCRYDIDWLKAAVPYYLLGHHGAMPPQPRFNTGERLNAIVMIVGAAVFGISGLAMWFAKGIIPANLYLALLMIHDLAFIVTFAMFMVHFYLAVIHPMMWQSLVSMRFGYVSESYAREHHARWYYGPQRAIRLWEQRTTEGGE
jgi:formate dehydrogenase subunit gamma